MNDTVGEILAEHRADELGAPFGVTLLSSVRRDADGSVTYPDMNGLVAAVVMKRLWRDERLTGAELAFVRKAAGIRRIDLGRSLGGSEEDVEAYETGPRPMTIAIEKYIRLHVFNAARRMDGKRSDDMSNYLEWTFDTWRPTFREVGSPIEIRLRHYPTGWQEVRDGAGAEGRPVL